MASYPVSIEKEIRDNHDFGNINRVIQMGVRNFEQLSLRQELIEKIAEYIDKYSTYISPDSLAELAHFANGDFFKSRQNREIKDKIKNLFEKISRAQEENHINPKSKSTGNASFPVVDPRGSVCRVEVLNSPGGNSANSRLLDDVGSALFTFLEQRTGKCLLWNPAQYDYKFTNTYGMEVNNIKGDSMGISLLMSLYSLITDQPVPDSISATGGVDRQGNVRPVEHISEKQKALQSERYYIDKILIARDQVLPEDSPSSFFERVSDVGDVIDFVFPGQIPDMDEWVDIETIVRTIKDLYKAYMLEPCIWNAESLVHDIEKKVGNQNTGSPGPDENLKYLFECCWRLGSAYCHKGDAENAEFYIRKAERLFENNEGAIDVRLYLQLQNNHAVLLKDLFRFREAEDLHLKIAQGMQTRGIENNEIGKNFSSMSQLYLAERKFEKAEEYQLKALEKVSSGDNHRNYNYLAQIYTRAGNLKKAETAFQSAKKRLKECLKSEDRNKNFPFLHWIESEYIYTKIKSLKRKPRNYLTRLHEIKDSYLEIGDYVAGLINKYCGMGMILYEGQNSRGHECLSESLTFFDQQTNPVLKLVGVTVRIEKLLTERWSEISKDYLIEEVSRIVEDLSIQKDIKKFFQKDLNKISRFLEQGDHSGKIEYLTPVLKGINEKIPY